MRVFRLTASAWGFLFAVPLIGLAGARDGVDAGIAQRPPTSPAPAVSPAVESARAEGVWRELPPPNRFGACAIYDPPNERMVLFGGYPAYGGEVWTLSMADPAVWRQLSPLGEPPETRTGAAAVYDPTERRMVVFGGGGLNGPLNDVWALSLSGVPTWSRVLVSGESPAARIYHSAIFDPAGERMIVFGGARGGSAGTPQLNDTWELSLSGPPVWSRIEPEGSLPPSRNGHAAVYVPERQVMLIVDGFAGDWPYLQDIWELSLTGTPRWTQVSAAGPEPLGGAWFSAVYDAAERRLVAVGLPPLGSTWSLSIDGGYAWQRCPAEGDVPPSTFGGQAIYDAMRRRLVFYEGGMPGVWTLSLDENLVWSELPAPHSNPSARFTHSAVYDPIRQQMIVFGGVVVDLDVPRFAISDETWTLALRGEPGWRRLEPSGVRPIGQGHVAIFDSKRDRMLVFGLCDQTSFGGGIISAGPTCSKEVWSLSLAGGAVWSHLSVSGEPPNPGSPSIQPWKAAIHDPVRDRMIVLAGGGTNVLHGLSLAESPRWTPIVSAGEVPAMYYAKEAFYDAPGDRMIVLEGNSGSLWSVSLEADRAQWRRLSTPGGGPGHVLAAFLDPSRRRLVSFARMQGGKLQPRTYDLGRDVGWTATKPSGLPPYARAYATPVYDPVFDRAIIYCGAAFGPDWGMGGPVADSWSLFLDTVTEEVGIDVQPGRRQNMLSLHSHRSTEVAILGSTTFSVDSVVASSVTLAGAGQEDDEPRVRWTDVNRDGHMDLVLRVETDDLQLARDDTLAVLRASTRHGARVVGFDRVRVMPGGRGREVDRTTQRAADPFLRARDPSPPGRPLRLEYRLPASGPARVEVLDVLGRRVATRELSPHAAHNGEIEVTESSSLPTGVYLIRLTQGQWETTARAVILH